MSLAAADVAKVDLRRMTFGTRGSQVLEVRDIYHAIDVADYVGSAFWHRTPSDVIE